MHRIHRVLTPSIKRLYMLTKRKNPVLAAEGKIPHQEHMQRFDFIQHPEGIISWTSSKIVPGTPGGIPDIPNLRDEKMKQWHRSARKTLHIPDIAVDIHTHPLESPNSSDVLPSFGDLLGMDLGAVVSVSVGGAKQWGHDGICLFYKPGRRIDPREHESLFEEFRTSPPRDLREIEGRLRGIGIAARAIPISWVKGRPQILLGEKEMRELLLHFYPRTRK